MNRLARATSRAHLEDVARFRATGEAFGRDLLTDPLAGEVRLVLLEALTLGERVIDNELRKAIGQTTLAWSDVLAARAEDVATESARRAIEAGFETNKRLGRVLRSLY